MKNNEEKTEFIVRKASVSDIEELVALHGVCLPPSAHIAARLGIEFLRTAYRWFLSTEDAFVLKVMDGEKIVGFSAIADWPYNRDLLRSCKMCVAKGLILHPAAFLETEFYSRNWIDIFYGEKKGHKRNVSQIAWTGVDPKYQGKGIGKKLRYAAIEEGKLLGKDAVVVGMRTGNHSARKLNESVGFKECHELCTRKLIYFWLNLDESDFHIYRLQPSDIESVVRLHIESFQGFFLSKIGPSFLAEFYRAFLIDADAVAFVVRSRSGEVVGVVVGSLKPIKFFRRLIANRWWAFALRGAKACVTNPRIVPRLFRALLYRGDGDGLPGYALLSSIAVHPSVRGLGVGKLLINKWTAYMKMLGAKGCYLATDAEDNESVNEFYKKNGWCIDKSYVTKEGRLMNRYIFGL